MSGRPEPPDGGLVGATSAVRIASREPAEALLDAARAAAGDASVAAVGSSGAVDLEPLLVATDGETTRYYASTTAAQARAVARALVAGEAPPTATATARHDPGPTELPAPDEGPLSVGVRAVLGRVGWVRPASLDDHVAAGGLQALGAASRPDAVLDIVGDLRGRGWGDAACDAPVGPTWRTARAADGEPAVVVNGHGNPVDRLLAESTPLAVLEGALVAARTVGATAVVWYLNEADRLARERVAAAAASLSTAQEAGSLPAVDGWPAVSVETGPDAYRAGEPTMALEALEGNHRLEARRRPPGPAEYGLSGRPTLVHTPRTLAQVERAAATGRDPTRLVAVTGDVVAPATVELPPGATLAEALDAVEVDGDRKAASVGGRFGGVATSLDLAPTPGPLLEAGLGTEGVVEVLGADRCLVAFAGERAAFAEAEHCGRCVPCREGSTQLARLLRQVYDGTFRPDAIEELTRVMTASSLCAFGVEAARPATTAMARFEAEFRAHAEGRCPTGACDADDRPQPTTGDRHDRPAPPETRP